ncbi:Putative inorganic phosphate cotransporter [Eumeta japonica]|uniref:Putative inorganic phosphate cotransporter n=1 Tax=Eumeta variegata TaxID=151549 RepID=A0A4C1ZJV4_EUMVA|nr:Putative inorganic phosphate cotransporter [Eumeta japonica]
MCAVKALGVRHAQAALLFLAMMLSYAMRVNMSLAIVTMASSDAFGWSVQIQSVVLSSFFWGYVVLQIPGGVMAARFGGARLILTCVGVNSLVTLLLPLAAFYGGWAAVCACRVLQGLAQGFLFPSTHALISKWVPLTEKSRIGTFIYAGGQFGTAIQLMVSGFVAAAWGWPAIFYLNGGLGVVWSIIYAFLGADSPQSSKIISLEERAYIQESLGHVGKQKVYPTPWCSIWTSAPFISLIIVHCGQNWGFWTLMTEMPSYMSNVLGVNIKSNGMLSALPYMAMYLMSFPLGFLSDFVLKKKWLSITASRKFSNSIGHWGPAVMLLGLAHVPAGNVALAVALLTFTVALNAGHYTGYLLVHVDMAPRFAGALMGITNCISNCISIIAPLVAGLLLKDESSAADWRKVFYVSSGVYLACNLLFIFLGTSERQPWNDPCDDKNLEAAIKVILKPCNDDYISLKSHRRIDLLPVLGKTMERMLVGCLQWHLMPKLQAEVVALHRAIRRAKNGKDGLVNVFSDSRTSLEVLTGPKIYYPLTHEARRNIFEIVPEGRTVRLFWVDCMPQSHTDNRMSVCNEHTDGIDVQNARRHFSEIMEDAGKRVKFLEFCSIVVKRCGTLNRNTKETEVECQTGNSTMMCFPNQSLERYTTKRCGEIDR